MRTQVYFAQSFSSSRLGIHAREEGVSCQPATGSAGKSGEHVPGPALTAHWVGFLLQLALTGGIEGGSTVGVDITEKNRAWRLPCPCVGKNIMSKKTGRSWRWLILVMLLAAGPSGFAAEPESTTSGLGWKPLQSKTTQMSEDTIDFDGKKLPVQTFTLVHGNSSYSQAVVLPLAVELKDYTSISFRMKLEHPAEAADDLGVHFLNEESWFLQNGPQQAGTKLVANSVEVAPGEYVFTWPIMNLFENVPMDEARSLALIYPVQSIPEGETVRILISEVTFHK
jgi:hypothetical protein